MAGTTLEVLEELRQAESQLEVLNREIHDLEFEKQGYLSEIMKGRGHSLDVTRTDQALREKARTLSKTKEHVGRLRGQLETKLAGFRKKLIEEKQEELNTHMERRERNLRRAQELELEALRYRYLVTGIKDHRLANVKDLLPAEIEEQGDFVPVDEAIGQIKLEVSRIHRMDSEALLKEYLTREGTSGRDQQR